MLVTTLKQFGDVQQQSLDIQWTSPRLIVSSPTNSSRQKAGVANWDVEPADSNAEIASSKQGTMQEHVTRHCDLLGHRLTCFKFWTGFIDEGHIAKLH
jgi:hypothetical protein